MQEGFRKKLLSGQAAAKNSIRMHHVFVYGTLKRGFRLHGYMEGAEFLAPARLKDYRMHRVSWYPAIVESPGEEVFGELFRIPESLLPVLDEVEDRGTMYERVVKEIEILEERDFSGDGPAFAGSSFAFGDEKGRDERERLQTGPRTMSAFVYVYLLPLREEPVVEGGLFL